MKNKILFFLIVFAAILSFPKESFAESVQSFKSQIKINSDSSLSVVETIVYDFGEQERHGIYRDIPYSYKARGGNYNLGISVKSVLDEKGGHYNYSLSRSGNNLDIKIGDANFTVTGVHTYVISYTVNGAINYFQDHDELYWNVNGNNWPVPIAQSSAEVSLPQNFFDINESGVNYSCFAGLFGVSAACESAAVSPGEAIIFKQNNLNIGEGLTIVVGFPKGLVHEPTLWEKIIKILRDNWVLGLPFIVFFLMWYLWYKKGKDPNGFSTIVAQYEAPEGLSPTESGTILDESVDNKDIAAEIINLAVNGYLKITKIEKKVLGIFKSDDYEFEQLKDYSDINTTFEKLLLDELFALGKKKKLSDLKNKFYVTLKAIREDIYQSVVLKGYFVSNPKTVRAMYSGIGGFIGVGGIWLGAAMQSIYAVLAFIASGIIIGIFGYLMPKPTLKGAKARQEILGLKLYLSVAEKDRLKFFNAPEKTPERFEKLLPYAIALGVETEWAKQFEGLYQNPPSWYNDPNYHGTFNSLLFVNSINNFSYSTNQTFASTPSGASGGSSGFGGGGFSGGGFGGGGGGSW